MEYIKKQFVDYYEDINEEKIEEYINFCQSNSYEGEDYSELHHILLQSHFPHFKREYWNIVRLRYTDHVKAHSILYEAIPENRGIFHAHFMMNGSSEELRKKNVEWLKGENNPSKRPDVRSKISAAKKGVDRPDMKGKKYFGASQETIDNVRKISRETHTGTVPVRLPDGNVIKVSVDDPRYLSGELKCIIGLKKGDKGPTSDPEVKARYHKSMAARQERFSKMSGYEIATHCLKAQKEGKNILKANGNMASNYLRLFNYAKLDWKLYLEVCNGCVQRLSKAKTTTRRLF